MRVPYISFLVEPIPKVVGPTYILTNYKRNIEKIVLESVLLALLKKSLHGGINIMNGSGES